MKILLLCNEQHNQVALANKVAAHFNLEGIVIEKPVAKKVGSFSFAQVLEKVFNRTLFFSLHKSWFGMLNNYKSKYPSFPPVRSISVENINSPEAIDFIRAVEPDLLMVSGTSLLRKNILSLPVPKGIINLHTGLSPYIKGGPNCTNWCIAENKFHLIGNTIMWIDAGIDSGDIITTALTPLTGNEDLLQLHTKVMDHAHELYLEALKKINGDPGHCPRVKQASITTGVTYYNRQWGIKAKWRLLQQFKKLKPYLQSEKYQQDKTSVVTVSLQNDQ